MLLAIKRESQSKLVILLLILSYLSKPKMRDKDRLIKGEMIVFSKLGMDEMPWEEGDITSSREVKFNQEREDDEPLTPTKNGDTCLRKISFLGGKFFHLLSFIWFSFSSFCLRINSRLINYSFVFVGLLLDTLILLTSTLRWIKKSL